MLSFVEIHGLGAGVLSEKRVLGDFVRDRRKALNLTQTALSDASGVPQRTISRIESNRNEGYLPEPWIVKGLAAGLQVSVASLLRAAGYEELDASDNERWLADSPRNQFFAANAEKLSEGDWETLKRLIERFTEEGEDL